jgi:hypothetical protein
MIRSRRIIWGLWVGLAPVVDCLTAQPCPLAWDIGAGANRARGHGWDGSTFFIATSVRSNESVQELEGISTIGQITINFSREMPQNGTLSSGLFVNCLGEVPTVSFTTEASFPATTAPDGSSAKLTGTNTANTVSALTTGQIGGIWNWSVLRRPILIGGPVLAFKT